VVRALKIGALSDGVLLVIGWALKIGSEFVRGWSAGLFLVRW
jgi:hypothetical protein